MKFLPRYWVYVFFGIMVALSSGISGWVLIRLSAEGMKLTIWQILLTMLLLPLIDAGLAYFLWIMVERAGKNPAAAPAKAEVLDCKRFVYVGADTFREGRISGDAMGQALQGHGKVITVTREIGNTIIVRKSGFASILEEKYPGIQIVGEIGDRDRELNNVDELLMDAFHRFPDLSGIYVVDGNTPAIVIKKLVETGKAGKIKLVCHDMVDETMHGIYDGVVTCTISQDPYAQGYDPVIYLYNYLVAGQLPPRQKMTTQLILITQENYLQYWDPQRGVIETGVAKDRRAKMVDQYPDRPLRIIFLGRDVTFYLPVKEGVMDAAKELKNRNVTVEWFDPTLPPYQRGYLAAVDDYVARKYDGIVMPIYSESYIPPINRAVEAGVPVAAFNSEPDNIHTIMNSLLYQSKDLLQITVALAKSAMESGERAAQINDAINVMRQALRLESESAGLAIESTRQISQAIGGIDKGAEEQTLAAASVSNTTQNISRAVEGTRQASITSQKTSVQAAQTARQGAETIQQTLHQIKAMSAAIIDSADKIHALNRLSRQIDSIVSTVNDMAEQSNLLALNANIEAARAGAEGGGFAVVAAEIRDLAQKSKQSTKEIGALVRAVQHYSQQMVVSVDEATRQAEAGSELASLAGQALKTLLESAETMHEQSEQIVIANAGAIEALDQLAEANERVSGVIMENAAATRQVTRNIQDTFERINTMTGISNQNVAAIEGIHLLSDQVADQSTRLKGRIASLMQMAEELQGAVVAFQLSEKNQYQ